MDDFTGLYELIDTMEADGVEWAMADSDYYREKARFCAMHKAAGAPANYIEQVVRGDEEVSKARLKLKLAQVKYKASQERVLAKKAENKAVCESMRFGC